MNFIQPNNFGKLLLSIKGNYSIKVKEGEVFESPIILKLEYISGVNLVPIEGAVIIVTI